MRRSFRCFIPLRQPTFFTRDHGFYRPTLLHPRYCLVYLEVGADETAVYIRRFLRHRAFRTRAQRMGKVIRTYHSGINYWQVNVDELASCLVVRREIFSEREFAHSARGYPVKRHKGNRRRTEGRRGPDLLVKCDARHIAQRENRPGSARSQKKIGRLGSVRFDLVPDLLQDDGRALSGKHAHCYDVCGPNPRSTCGLQGIEECFAVRLQSRVLRLAKVQIVTEPGKRL